MAYPPSTTDSLPILSDQNLPPTPPSEPYPNVSTTASQPKLSLSPSSTRPQQHKHIWVITGPAGCGKTSVAESLHQTFGMPYLEGDSFHTPSNVAKMAAGHPLTDADRWDWLITLRSAAVHALASPVSPATPQENEGRGAAAGVIVTCSALKRKYRDVVRVAAYQDAGVRVRFVFLEAEEGLLMDRVRARQGHYMKDCMVRSQFESLEVPTGEEWDVLRVDASGSGEEVRALAREAVEREMARG